MHSDDIAEFFLIPQIYIQNISFVSNWIFGNSNDILAFISSNYFSLGFRYDNSMILNPLSLRLKVIKKLRLQKKKGEGD